MPDAEDALLTANDVEELYRIPVSTQRTWRHTGEQLGKYSFKIGARIVYYRADVTAWVSAQRAATLPS